MGSMRICSAEKNQFETNQRGQVSGDQDFWAMGLLMCKVELGAGNRVGQFYYDRDRENYNCVNVQFWGQKMVVFMHGVRAMNH